MTWISEYLRPSAARIDDEHPYLSSLLRSRPAGAPLAQARLRNFLEARRAEETRPEVLRSLPYHVVADPSNVCNLACPLCVQATDPDGRRRRLVDCGRFEELLDRIESHVIRLDLFNWGEPLLHPQFPELVRAASRRSIFTRTSSHFSHRHGIPAEALVEAGLDYIVASIDGSTQEVYEKYRVGGSLETTVRNLEGLVQARERLGASRPVIEWQFLVLRHNEDDIERCRAWARGIGVDVFRYGGARGRMSTKVLSDTCDNVQESKSLLLDAAHHLSEYDESGQKRRREEAQGCRWLWGKVALHPDGGISPCWSSWFESKDYGSWLHQGLAEVWHGPVFQRARRSASQGGDPGGELVCDGCAHFKSFVPTPDGDKEPLPDLERLERVTELLTRAGLPPAPEVVRALRHELEGSRARPDLRAPAGALDSHA